MLSVKVFCGVNESIFPRITAEMSSSPCVNMLLDNVTQPLMHSCHSTTVNTAFLYFNLLVMLTTETLRPVIASQHTVCLWE